MTSAEIKSPTGVYPLASDRGEGRAKRAGWVRPMPLLTDAPPTNLQEALERLKVLDPPHPYAAQVASALRRMPEVIGKPATRISTDPPTLRDHITNALPARAKMTDKRWRRICSLVSTYLRTTGINLEPGRDTAGHSQEWRELLSGANKGIAVSISRFASFCTRKGIEPTEVATETFVDFAEALHARSLEEEHEAIARTTVTNWNRGVTTVPGWPQLTILQERHARFYSLPWEAYSESYRADVDAYLNTHSNGRIFSVDYRRSVKPSTIALRRRQLRIASALLIESGVPIENLTSLRVLAQPDNVVALCERHLERKGEATHSLAQIVNTLARLAERRLHDVNEVQLLRVYAKNIADDRRERHGPVGMTQRNKNELRQFDLAENRKALLNLPDRIFAEARPHAPTVASARRVRLAMAVEMLTSCACRGANLSQMEIDRHFSDQRQGHAWLRYLTIPAGEMKGNAAFEVPLPDRTRLLLDEYLEVYWPLLAPQGSLYVFPGRGGRLRDKNHFAELIVAFVLKETGVRMHLHLFRHFAVKLHKRHHPGDIETPRRFLAHKSYKTTLTHYTEDRTDDAFATYHSSLDAERSHRGSSNAAGL